MQNGEIHAKNVAYGVVLSLNSEGCSIHDLSVPLIRDPEVKKTKKNWSIIVWEKRNSYTLHELIHIKEKHPPKC